ncbi:MAG TPA: hypothetical protein PKU97_08365 [Kofleriaceae bacterium]|nr:hypothetical protein [Kofleriaceae bacterium]
MKLALVLARAADLPAACALTEAAHLAGDEVAWFAMDDAAPAVVALIAGPHPPWLCDTDVTLCATSLDRRQLAGPAGARVGSQDDHAALLAWADRTVALT